MTTYQTILDRHQVAIPAHLEAQAEVPVLTGPQRQGDVFILPQRHGVDDGTPIPAEGVVVVRGEAGGNTHLLTADGGATWRPVVGSQDCGVLNVPQGASAWLIHPEHGANGIGPGSYILRRQRQQADEIRLVAD